MTDFLSEKLGIYHIGSFLQVHLKEEKSDIWFLIATIAVRPLSAEPVIPISLFGRLTGTFNLRVCAQNLAGRGACADLLVVLCGRFDLSD